MPPTTIGGESDAGRARGDDWRDHATLADSQHADGRGKPRSSRSQVGNGGCSSYINSYLANGAVIVLGYGYDRDPLAVETYRRLYPRREIVQVQIGHIAQGGGGIHCITQQQPASLRP